MTQEPTKAEKPTRDELMGMLDAIEKLIRARLTANPDPATVDTLIEIRQQVQNLAARVLVL